MNHGLVEAAPARISSTVDSKGPATMTDKTTAPSVIETTLRLLRAEGGGMIGGSRDVAAVRVAPSPRPYPSAVRPERRVTKPIRATTGYRAKPQRPLRIPGRG
ncbi:hypothetical protein [Nocardia sp. CY41]|uniref:hypothetical protein n=1 Tax=Nocardia sp. CY41 TaxID=2608686 RepID=UPI00135A1DED|nr:hypothetical protein [Nocardia sp. CY41]